MKFRFAGNALIALLLGSTATFANDTRTVTIASPWEITSYDIVVSGFAIQKLQVMENLVDADVLGQLRPGLATAWSVTEDGLTWTFTLRDGVTFHDGTSFDSSAALGALTRAWNEPGVLSKAPIDAIEEADGAIVFRLSQAFMALPSLLAHATTVIPSPSSFDDAGTPSALIGTGPFAVSEFTPPQSIDLVRFDDYWGALPSIQSANYLASGRAETRTLLAESGDANLVFTLDPSGFQHLTDVDTVETVAVPIPRVVTLKVNTGHSFFDSVEARQALSLAINRQAIATAITRFPESAAGQLFPPALSAWHSDDMPALEYDVEEAKRLLATLGWNAGDEGVLVKDGERFSIVLRTFPDRPELPLMAAALQDMWKEIGIELEVSVANYSEIPAGHQDGSLHVALYARNYGLTPDPIGTVLQDFGPGGGDWGAMGWTQTDVSDALAEIAATSDQALRVENIRKVVGILQNELPVIPITWYQHTAAIDGQLGGVVIDPLQRNYGLSQMYWK